MYVCLFAFLYILPQLRSSHIQNFNYVQFFSLFNDKITVENFKIIVKYKQVKSYQLFQNLILSLYYYSSLSLSLSQESYTVCTDLYHHFLILILFCKHFPEQLNFQNILRATIYFIVWIYHNVVNHSLFRYLMLFLFSALINSTAINNFVGI